MQRAYIYAPPSNFTCSLWMDYWYIAKRHALSWNISPSKLNGIISNFYMIRKFAVTQNYTRDVNHIKLIMYNKFEPYIRQCTFFTSPTIPLQRDNFFLKVNIIASGNVTL